MTIHENYTGYNTSLKANARSLRKSMTDQERRLWYVFLRNYPVKWYRQRPIGQYIADFYCSKANLVIELDGSQHYEPSGTAYDVARTRALEEYGLTVVRIANSEFRNNFDGVCEYIDQLIKERMQD